MITENAYKKLDDQQKIDYLQKTLDVQVAYANELEIQMADVEEENLNFRLQLGRSAKHTDKVDAENKRLREAGSAFVESCNHEGDGGDYDFFCELRDALSKES